MAADTLRQECDERTGKYRENGAGKDCDPLHACARVLKILHNKGVKLRSEVSHFSNSRVL